ncbi:winged helix-turn-helix domain-containing protein [Phytoactinopolyspora endophytica]|uniref:winged helix-turn-helix domain-containing protein n=1 Tax=Phytoactinopolyspora endophytica TaxID=1642495 RepID=UPI00101C42A5|nr:winged helix-turn-helix domain-containing protein [Phytoactinopolyspora endophytica]
MAAPFDPAQQPPGYLYLQLADYLTDRITSGELKPGAMLPGELLSAQEYGVSTGTIRRARDVLLQRGVVAVLPALGTYVTEPEYWNMPGHGTSPPSAVESRSGTTPSTDDPPKTTRPHESGDTHHAGSC